MKDSIVRAAMGLFARHGYAGTSMREIAEAAAVTKAALYYYFPDKESLYREAMAATSRYLCERVREAAEGIEDPAERLRAVVHAKLRLFVEEGDLIRSLYNELFMPPDPEAAVSRSEAVAQGEREIRNSVAACAEGGLLDPADVEMTALCLNGAVEYSGARWLLDPAAPKPGPALGDRLLARILPSLAGAVAKKPRTRRKRRRTIAGLATLLSLLWGAAPARAQAPEEATPTAKTGGLPDQSPVERTEIVAIPGGEAALSLEECVAEAIASNASLQAVREETGELRAQKLQAVATGLPTLDLTGSWSRSRDPSFALDETFGGSGDDGEIPAPFDTLFSGFILDPVDVPAQTFWRTSLNASWELRPYRVYSAVRAAGSKLRQQDLAVTDAEHRTAEDVFHAYYGVVAAAERLDALEAESEARREFLDISRRRFRVEFATDLDTLQAAVSLANLKPQLRRALQDVRNSAAKLNVLMGRKALAPITVRATGEVTPEEVDTEWALGRVEERPDVRRLVLEESVLRRTASVQGANNHPYLNVDASYGFVGRTLGTITDSGHDFWNARVAVTLPIFDGLSTKGQVQQTKASIRRTERQRQEAIRQARLEILTLAGDLEAARENHDAARLNLVRAENALSRVQQRYSVGKGEYLEVLNAQSERFTARSELIAARLEVFTLTASLKRALGISPLETFAGTN